MPKILRIINRFNLGGPIYNVTYLTKYLGEEYETKLIGGIIESHEQDAQYIPNNLGIKTTVIENMHRSINLKKDYRAYKEIVEVIKGFKPDIVHTHASKAGFLGRLAAINQKIPIIVHTFHGHVFHSYFNKITTNFYKVIERFLAKKSTAIITISLIQQNEIIEENNICSKKKSHVIPLGFELDKFQEDQLHRRKNFRSKYNIADDDLVIGIVGRLVPIKNHKLFINAISKLINNNKKVKAVIIGDGDLRQELESLALNNNLLIGDNIIFTSWIKQVEFAYPAFDIVCLTSYNEGTPVSLIEAQAASLPVISTKVGGVENIVLENESGFLIDSNDERSLISKLEVLLSDKKLRDQFGIIGKRNVFEKYHYSVLVKNTENLYLQLLSKNNKT